MLEDIDLIEFSHKLMSKIQLVTKVEKHHPEGKNVPRTLLYQEKTAMV